MDTSWATVQGPPYPCAAATSQEGQIFLGAFSWWKWRKFPKFFFSVAIFLAKCGWSPGRATGTRSESEPRGRPRRVCWFLGQNFSCTVCFYVFCFKFVEFVDINIVRPFSATNFVLAPENWCKNNRILSLLRMANLVCHLFHGQRFNEINYQPHLVIAAFLSHQQCEKNMLSLPKKVHKILGNATRRWPPFCWKSMRSATDLLWNVICWCVSRNSWGQVADTGPKPKQRFLLNRFVGFFLGKSHGKSHGKTESLFLQCNSARAVVNSVRNCSQACFAQCNSSRCINLCIYTWRNSQQHTTTWFSDSSFQHFIMAFLESQHFWKSLPSLLTRLVIFRTPHGKEPLPTHSRLESTHKEDIASRKKTFKLLEIFRILMCRENTRWLPTSIDRNALRFRFGCWVGESPGMEIGVFFAVGKETVYRFFLKFLAFIYTPEN